MFLDTIIVERLGLNREGCSDFEFFYNLFGIGVCFAFFTREKTFSESNSEKITFPRIYAQIQQFP